MTGRDGYIAGLRNLATLLADNPGLGLPHHGQRSGLALAIYPSGADLTTQILTYIQAMDEPPTMTLTRHPGDSMSKAWIDITGTLAGLHVALYLRGREIGTLVDGAWSLPSELLAVVNDRMGGV